MVEMKVIGGQLVSLRVSCTKNTFVKVYTILGMRVLMELDR